MYQIFVQILYLMVTFCLTSASISHILSTIFQPQNLFCLLRNAWSIFFCDVAQSHGSVNFWPRYSKNIKEGSSPVLASNYRWGLMDQLPKKRRTFLHAIEASYDACLSTNNAQWSKVWMRNPTDRFNILLLRSWIGSSAFWTRFRLKGYWSQIWLILYFCSFFKENKAHRYSYVHDKDAHYQYSITKPPTR